MAGIGHVAHVTRRAASTATSFKFVGSALAVGWGAAAANTFGLFGHPLRIEPLVTSLALLIVATVAAVLAATRGAALYRAFQAGLMAGQRQTQTRDRAGLEEASPRIR